MLIVPCGRGWRPIRVPGELTEPVPLLLAIALGGAVGSLARWVLEEAVVWSGPTSGSWPWATLMVNVLGALAIGALLSSRLLEGRPEWWRPMLVTGVLGGFTTFSALALESGLMIEAGNTFAALGYIAVTVVAGLLAVGLGRLVVRDRSPA